MKIPIRLGRSNIRLAYQERFNEREIWHKLVVKVISWKEGLLEGGIVKFKDKISAKEWGTYSRRTVERNTTWDKQKVLSLLKETRNMIKKHGGFE